MQYFNCAARLMSLFLFFHINKIHFNARTKWCVTISITKAWWRHRQNNSVGSLSVAPAILAAYSLFVETKIRIALKSVIHKTKILNSNIWRIVDLEMTFGGKNQVNINIGGKCSGIWQIFKDDLAEKRVRELTTLLRCTWNYTKPCFICDRDIIC